MKQLQKIANNKIYGILILSLFLIANFSIFIHNVNHCETKLSHTHQNNSEKQSDSENDCKICINLKLNHNLHLNNITIDFSIVSIKEYPSFIIDKKESFSLLTISNKAPPAL